MRKEITDFKYGIVNKIEQQSIYPGASLGSLNFLTKGDHFELRRGTLLVGAEIEGDNNPSRGGCVAKRSDGVEILYRKRGRKLEYILEDDVTWTEVGTDLFPVAAEDDEVSFVLYSSLAGDQMFFSSPNSSMYKIMLANPGSYTDLVSTDFRGYIFTSQNRIFLVQRTGTNGSKDKTGVYVSFIDEQNYTTVATENIGTGDGATLTFADTLAFKAGGAKRTCFGIAVTDGVETFVDNFDGTLTGSAGGTGTINYTTGAISVTFVVAPLGAVAITCDYQWEDSTNGGLADFSYTSPNRVAGEGDVFRQDAGGGVAQAIDTYGDTEYCFHQFKTWALTLSEDDTTATNLEYRKNVGIPNWRARVATGDGIYFIDTVDETNPQIRILELEGGSTEVIPRTISDQIDLSVYRFDNAWMERFGELILLGCRTVDSTMNNRVVVYNTVWKSFDVVDFYADWGQVWYGTFIFGDSLSPNVYVGFSGFDDNEAIVGGSYETSEWDLDDADHLKKVKKAQIEGLIQTNQIIGVYGAPDRGDYTFLGYIRGDGEYVDAESVSIGSETIGSGEIGGGSITEAFHYYRELKCAVGKFGRLKLKFVVESDEDGNEGIGYFSVSTIAFDDIRVKQEKLAKKYRITRS